MNIDEKFAKVILEMEDVCLGEGIGPDNTELLLLIFENFPRLKEEFSETYKIHTRDNLNVQIHSE